MMSIKVIGWLQCIPEICATCTRVVEIAPQGARKSQWAIDTLAFHIHLDSVLCYDGHGTANSRSFESPTRIARGRQLSCGNWRY